jgi:hypothetical protein
VQANPEPTQNKSKMHFYRQLNALGLLVLYKSYRSVIPKYGCHTKVWRVHFMDESLPFPLSLNSEPVNQIRCSKFLYPVYFKDLTTSPMEYLLAASTWTSKDLILATPPWGLTLSPRNKFQNHLQRGKILNDRQRQRITKTRPRYL